MGSTINKNEHILHKSQSEVLSRNLDQSKSFIRSSTIMQTQKQLEVVSSLKKSLQQSIKGDDCDDSPLQSLNTNQQRQNPEKMLIYDLNRDLQFEARTLNSKIKASMTNSTIIPAMISLKAKDLIVQEDQRTSLDLVCIIDRSASMCGEKIKMVKDTLLTLLNCLSENDRFSIILFDDRTQLLFELKNVIKQNQQFFREKIGQIEVNGGTNIANGLIQGLKLLKNRNYINQVTSIFLLTDGKDSSTEGTLDQIFSGTNFPIIIHTFGYGNDHDPKIMTQISNKGNGKFYFIQNLSLLDEFFIDALGSLITVVGQQVKIDINCNPQSLIDKTIISKTFGTMWEEKVSQREYQINFSIINSGQNKDFVFELEIPKFKNNIEIKEQIVTVVNFTLQLQCPKTKLNIKKICQLNLIFCDGDGQLLNLEKDLDIAAQYYRVKGTDVIEQASLACDRFKFEEARQLIQNIILEIESYDKIKNLSQKILEDLRQALSACDRQEKEACLLQQQLNYAQTMMMQQVSNNYDQSSFSVLYDENGHQYRTQNYYSNSYTRHLLSTVQNSKSTECSSFLKDQ